jgi:hypothetical protein
MIDGIRKTEPICWTAEMPLARSLRIGALPAAIVNAGNMLGAGLLTESVFTTVELDQTRGELVLVR